MFDRDSLLAKYRGFNVPWGPIGEPVYKRTYSHVKSNGRKETWPETVVRAVVGNVLLAGRAMNPQLSVEDDGNVDNLVKLGLIEPDEVQKLCELILPFGSLPAGRHLNASGRIGRQFLFNCHSSGWDKDEPWAHFTFLFDALMQGGGVGSNYSNRYIETLPKVETAVDLHIICRENHPDIEEFYHLLTEVVPKDRESHGRVFLVPDSREGWVEGVELIMRHMWMETKTFSREVKLVLDVSGIRARGEPLKTSGGIACGPGPLVSMLIDLTKHLNGCFDTKLTSLDAMVLDHTLASCVVAGGKRRSSRMSVKSWMDPDIFEFINCKREDGAHWTTNISVETDNSFDEAYRDEQDAWHDTAKAVARAIVLGCRANGEPGFWNRSKAMEGEREPDLMFSPNPCGEIGLHQWENCNLGHVNLQYFAQRPLWDLEEAFRLVTRWLMRATFGDIPDKRQREVVDRNRRIGVGFLGMHGYLAIRGVKYSACWDHMGFLTTLKMCRKHIEEEARRYAEILAIPVPVKFTTIAPTGTLAALTGTAGGDQAIYSPWFIRRVRYSDMDPELKIKMLEGYRVIADPDARNTSIVEYWCEDPLVGHVRAAGHDPAQVIEAQDEIDLLTNLTVQGKLQEVWADNSISHTINLPPQLMPAEEDMEHMLMSFHRALKGTTIFPDKSRKNPPFERVTKEQFDAWPGRKEVTMVEDVCKGGCPVK